MDNTAPRQWHWLFAAWMVALVATLGALFVGEVMGQAPCVLCWYQRIAMFPLVVTLGVGAFLNDRNAVLYSLPLAVVGLGFAGFHTLVFYGVAPEAIQPCTASGPSCSDDGMTLFGTVPLPLLSSVAFALITIFLIVVTRRRP
jgi:disulfide bond formation protein DsbB